MSDREPVSSVVLLSGGLDSAANLAICAEQDRPVLALTVRYGQRAQDREVRAARALCNHYGVSHRTLELPWLGEISASALTRPQAALPSFRRSELDDAQVTKTSARAVWVPNRNGVLIQIAAAWAESLGAGRVIVGFNREEAATFPDNTGEFLERSSRALALSTSNQVEVFCYTTKMDKKEIVRALRGLRRPFPFALLWSCYEGGDQPCGRCESCQRLARALEAAPETQGR